MYKHVDFSHYSDDLIKMFEDGKPKLINEFVYFDFLPRYVVRAKLVSTKTWDTSGKFIFDLGFILCYTLVIMNVCHSTIIKI